MIIPHSSGPVRLWPLAGLSAKRNTYPPNPEPRSQAESRVSKPAYCIWLLRVVYCDEMCGQAFEDESNGLCL